MLDIGWTELLIIGVVALVVVGPKDLPKMFRTLGQLTGKARAMAREFQRAMDAAADETGVKDMARDLRDTASGRKFKEEMGLDELDRDMRAMGRPDQWGKDTGKPGAGKPETVAQRKAREAAAAADGAEAEDDAAMAAEHDAEMAARNKKTSALEAERLKAADRAAEARRKAAEIRARRDAEAAAGAASPSATPAAPEAPGTGAAAASGDGAPVGKSAARKPARPARRQDPEAET